MTLSRRTFTTSALGATALGIGLGPVGTGAGVRAAAATTTPRPGLRSVTPRGLRIGSAANWKPNQRTCETDQQYRDLLGREFNSVTPENQMKFRVLQPEPGRFDFSGADALVKFATDWGQTVRGHTLLWHSNPAWVSEADLTPDRARAILRDHITTVCQRYRGRILHWDVANEVMRGIHEQGGVGLRTDDNPFLRACADDPVGLIADAFRWAHAADPAAKLYLNDFDVTGFNAKSDAYVPLIRELQKRNAPIHGFGIQAHERNDQGVPADVQQNLERFADLGLEVSITEADIRVWKVPAGGPTPEQVRQHTEGYRRLVQAAVNVKACTSFTTWGFTDKYSWLPADGGFDAPAIMDANYQPKPAYRELERILPTVTRARSVRR